MAVGRVGYVVQELDSYTFLCAMNGDVGFTPLLHEADPFDAIEEAVETAHFVVGGNFKVTSIWVND